jgi:hypothetical protein
MRPANLSLRVSVATLDRVIFPHPCDGTPVLALERKATLLEDSGEVYVRAQPYGGVVRLLDADALRDLIGVFRFDNERSRSEQDFRILIRLSDWAAVRRFCLQHLQNTDDPVLETDPSRELIEEFAEGLQIDVRADQYTCRPVGFAVEDQPTPTDNIYSRGLATVRVYRIFEVRIVDAALGQALLSASERYHDAALQTLARNSARGRANTVLTLPLHLIRDFYLGVKPGERYATGHVADHLLDVSVLALFDDVAVPQLQRL